MLQLQLKARSCSGSNQCGVFFSLEELLTHLSILQMAFQCLNAVFRGSFWPDRAIILVCIPAVLLMFYTHLKFYRGGNFFHTSLNSLTSVAYRFSWNRDFLWAAFNHHVLQLSTWSGRQSTLKQGQTVVF